MAIKEISVMPAAAKVASVLRRDIRNGRYSMGERLANERVLATNLGVSRETIRQSLKILSQERLIVSQHGRGTFVTSPAFASDNITETALIGAMVYEKEYYFGTILQGAFSHATRRGYILATGMNGTEETEQEHLDAFIKNGIKGLIFAPSGGHSSKTYDRLVKEKIPTVIIDKKLQDRYEDFVSVDDYQGTVLATKHLIELGHSRIGYIGYDNPDDMPCQPERLLGFISTCKRLGLSIPNQWISEVTSGNYLEKMRSVLQQENRPTAFVLYNDYLAVAMLDAARDLNIRIPEDLSVVGFDDAPMAKNCSVPITTVSPRPHELGKTVVDLLVNKIENSHPQPKRSILIEPRLVIRNSTAKPNEG